MKFAQFVSILTLAILAACTVPSNPTPNSSGRSLTIVIDNDISRTLVPEIDMQPATFSVSGMGPNGASFFEEVESGVLTVDSVVAGEWTIVVAAQNEAGDLIGEGQAIASVATGTANIVSVAVRPVSGEGTLALSTEWDPFHYSHVSFEATLTPSFGAEVPLPITIGEDPIGQTGEVALAAGYYTLTLWMLEGGERVSGVVEIVRIVAGQRTSGRYAFSNESNPPDPTLELDLDVDMQNPLEVSVDGVASAGLNSEVPMTAEVAGYEGNVMYFWYLNGNLKATGPDYTFGGSPTYGSFNIDLVAYAADGTRAGSTRRVLEIENTNALRNASGVFSRTVSSSSGNLSGVKFDDLGNIIAVGTVNAGDWDFGNGVAVDPNRPSYVVVKFDGDGQPLWARALVSSTLSATGTDLAIDSEGNIVVSGSLAGTGTANIAGDVFITGANYCSVPMLLKFTSAGDAVWARTVDDHQTTFNTSPAYESVAIGAGDAIYVTGTLPGNTISTFGNGVTLTASTLSGLLVAKYSSFGDAIWARSAASSSGEAFAYGSGIAVDTAGNVVVVGQAACQTLTGQLDFGGGQVVDLNRVTPTGFAVKYDPAGLAQWTRSVSWSQGGGHPGTHFLGVATDVDGNIFAAGSVYGSGHYTFGTDSGGLPVAVDWRGTWNNSGTLLVKYDASGTPCWARNMSVSNLTSAWFVGVAVDNSGDVYASGPYDGNESGFFPFRFGNGISAPRNSPSGSLLVKYSNDGVPLGATSQGGPDGPRVGPIALGSDGSPVVAGSASGTLLLGRY